MRRPRGPGGRFLTAEEIAAQQKASESSDPSSFHPNPNPSAEERKALKASELGTGPTSVLEATGNHTESFAPIGDILNSSNEARTDPNPEFRPFTDTPISSASAAGHDVSGGYPTSAPSQSSSGSHVQYSDMNAGPLPSGSGLP